MGWRWVAQGLAAAPIFKQKDISSSFFYVITTFD